MRFTYSFLFIAMLLLLGCSSGDSAKKGDNMDRNIPSTVYQIIKSGSYPYDYSHLMDQMSRTLVYYSDNSSDLSGFAKEYTLFTGEKAPVFDGTMIIVNMGKHNTGGYSYGIKEIISHEKFIEVKLLIKRPSTSSLVTMALTNPYIVILLPDNHKEVKVIQE